MAGRHLRRRPLHVVRSIGIGLSVVALGAGIGAGGVLAVDRAADSTSDGSDEVVTAGQVSVPDLGSARQVAERGPIRLAFAGDVYAEHGLGDRLADTPADFVGPFAEVFRDADLVVVNVEAAIAEGGTAEDKEFTFRAPPGIVDALIAGGVDIVSVANNHGRDFGAAGLAETLAVADRLADAVLGVGRDEDEAYAPIVREVGGYSVAVIGATQVIGASFIQSWTATADSPGLASAKRVDRLLAEVEAARRSADVVVAFLHWGVETEECPSAGQRELAEALADAGADVIVGSHAHRVQGGGRLDDAFVHYGLGNFLFHAQSDASARSGVFVVDVVPRQGGRPASMSYDWVPGRVTAGVPQVLAGDEADEARAAWEDQRSCTGLEP